MNKLINVKELFIQRWIDGNKRILRDLFQVGRTNTKRTRLTNQCVSPDT